VAAYERSRGELERKLLDAVMRDGHEATPESGRPAVPSRALLAGMGLAVLAIAATGYWWTRAPAPAAEVPLASARQAGTPPAPASAPHALSFKQIEDMADKLAQRLKADPKDPQGWAMLARSYTMLGRRAEAVTAYERAVALQGQDASLLADYADALAVTRESRRPERAAFAAPGGGPAALHRLGRLRARLPRRRAGHRAGQGGADQRRPSCIGHGACARPAPSRPSSWCSAPKSAASTSPPSRRASNPTCRASSSPVNWAAWA
jgi:tetratricopeptide (TPR) repeat protein